MVLAIDIPCDGIKHNVVEVEVAGADLCRRIDVTLQVLNNNSRLVLRNVHGNLILGHYYAVDVDSLVGVLILGYIPENLVILFEVLYATSQSHFSIIGHVESHCLECRSLLEQLSGDRLVICGIRHTTIPDVGNQVKQLGIDQTLIVCAIIVVSYTIAEITGFRIIILTLIAHHFFHLLQLNLVVDSEVEITFSLLDGHNVVKRCVLLVLYKSHIIGHCTVHGSLIAIGIHKLKRTHRFSGGNHVNLLKAPVMIGCWLTKFLGKRSIVNLSLIFCQT